MALQQQMQPPQGQGGPPGGAPPPGAGGGPPQAQPGPPTGEPGGMPPFEPVDTSPTATGMGTPQAVPDVYSQMMEVLNQIGDQIQGKITRAYPEGNGVHIELSEESDSANSADRGILRQSLQAAGIATVTFSRTPKEQG